MHEPRAFHNGAEHGLGLKNIGPAEGFQVNTRRLGGWGRGVGQGMADVEDVRCDTWAARAYTVPNAQIAS